MKNFAAIHFADQWRNERITQDKIYSWSWFKPALMDFMAATLEPSGLRGELDENVACTVFLEWTTQVEQYTAYARERPIDHAHFICGRLLRGFLRSSPFKFHPIEALPSTQLGMLQQEWPEGFLGLSFVCTLLEAYRQDLGAGPITWQEALFERHWRSFRENVDEDVNQAGPFLDFFLGLEPIWEYPTLLSKRPALEDAPSSF